MIDRLVVRSSEAVGLDSKHWHGRLLKSFEIGFKRVVLQAYRLLGGIKKAEEDFDPDKLKKVLFIRHDKLGDMVISLPIFHNLKRRYPDLRIDLVCGKDNYEIVRTDPHITRAYYYHKKPLQDMENIRQMRAEKYDCVVDLIFGASVTATILVSRIAGKGFKLGVGKLKYARFFDQTVECERRKYHIIESTGRILNLFGIDLKDCDMTPRLYLEEKDFEVGRGFAGELRKQYGVIAAVNLSAGRPGRTWPLEKYFRLIEGLRAAYPEWVFVLNYAPSEFWKAEKVLARFQAGVAPIPRGLNIRQVAGLLSNFDFLITPDTSLTHLASAFNLPSLVMFSGDHGNFVEWGPYNPKIRAIRSSDPNRIEQIEVEDVLKAFAAIVTEERQGYLKSSRG